MNKEQIIQSVKEGLNKGVITKHDLNTAILSHEQLPHSNSNKNSDMQSSLVTKVLYILGGLIALIGIVVLVNSNWDALGVAGRLVVTFGFSLATYVAALILYKKKIQPTLVQLFFVLSAAVAPVASFVLLDSLGVANPTSVSSQIGVAIVLLLIYLTALCVTKRSILHVIVGIFFSWAYYTVVAQMIKGTGFSFDAIRDLSVYATMILGFAYLAYSIWLEGMLKKNFSLSLRRVASLYTVFAFLFVLLAALTLNGIWDLLYAFLALGAVIVSVNLRTTAGLIVTALAIGIYVIHISSKYFADSIGWSTVLVVIGFAIIGIGYLTYYLNKKYIAKA